MYPTTLPLSETAYRPIWNMTIFHLLCQLCQIISVTAGSITKYGISIPHGGVFRSSYGASLRVCFNSSASRHLQFVRRAVKRSPTAVWTQANQFSLEVWRVPCERPYGLIIARHSLCAPALLSQAFVMVNSRNWRQKLVDSWCSLLVSTDWQCNVVHIYYARRWRYSFL